MKIQAFVAEIFAKQYWYFLIVDFQCIFHIFQCIFHILSFRIYLDSLDKLQRKMSTQSEKLEWWTFLMVDCLIAKLSLLASSS